MEGSVEKTKMPVTQDASTTVEDDKLPEQPVLNATSSNISSSTRKAAPSKNAKRFSSKVYKLVLYINNHHLSHLSNEAMLRYLDCVDVVRSSSSNMNENYSCVEMLWKVSDHLALQESQTTLEDLWLAIFSKLYNCCVDPDSQVRHSSLKIYSSLLAENGSLFSKRIWLITFRDLYFSLFDEVFEIFLNFASQKKEKIDFDSPDHVRELMSQFNDDKSKRDQSLQKIDFVMHKPLGDIGKNWQ